MNTEECKIINDEGLLNGLKELFYDIMTKDKMFGVAEEKIYGLNGNDVSIAFIDCGDGWYVNELNEYAEKLKKERVLLRQRIAECDTTITVKEQAFAQSNYTFHCHGYGETIRESLSAHGPTAPKPLFRRSIKEYQSFPIYDYVISLNTMCNVPQELEFFALANLINLFCNTLILVWGNRSKTVSSCTGRTKEEIRALFRAFGLLPDHVFASKLSLACTDKNNKDSLLMFVKGFKCCE